jgi:hypothetical protein
MSEEIERAFNRNFKPWLTPKEILKWCVALLMIIVMWFAIQDVKTQTNAFCQAKYKNCICQENMNLTVDSNGIDRRVEHAESVG